MNKTWLKKSGLYADALLMGVSSYALLRHVAEKKRSRVHPNAGCCRQGYDLDITILQKLKPHLIRPHRRRKILYQDTPHKSS